jgi:hypothetical protein
VIGHGHGFLAERGHALDELGEVAGAVEQRVLGVQMEVSELGHGPGSILAAERITRLPRNAVHEEKTAEIAMPVGRHECAEGARCGLD